MKRRLLSTALALILAFMLCVPAFGEYFEPYTGFSTSLSDALKEYGAGYGSFTYRAGLAECNGFCSADEYCGDFETNIAMMERLRNGCLLRPDTGSTARSEDGEYFPAYKASDSIVDSLNALGYPSSFEYRTLIAEANGVSQYCGSSDQNQYMVSELRRGTLKIPGSSSNSATLIGAVPISAQQTEVMDVVDDAPLRVKAKGSSESYIVLTQGDCVSVVGMKHKLLSKTAWYQVDYAGLDLFVYSDHLKPHVHIFEPAAKGISVCRCGAYQMNANGAEMMDASILAPTLLSGELQAAAVALEAGIAGMAEAGVAVATAALPALTVAVVVGGVVLLVTLGNHATTINQVEVLDSSSPKHLFDKLNDGKYYAAFGRRDNCFLAYYPEGMTLDEANNYLVAAVMAAEGISYGSGLYQAVNQKYNDLMTGIYCYSSNDALLLAERFDNNGPNYSYGSSLGKTPNSPYYKPGKNYPGNKESEFNTDGCYEHYHVYVNLTGKITDPLHKAGNVHVFFGLPLNYSGPLSNVA